MKSGRSTPCLVCFSAAVWAAALSSTAAGAEPPSPAPPPESAPRTPLPALTVREQRDPQLSPLATVSPLSTTTPRLTDLFRSVPGILVQDSFGGFDPPRLAVRGSGIQSAPTSRGLWLSLWDMPLNAADGSFHLPLLEGEWLDAAALTRGTSAGVPALGGALALGGSPFVRGGSLRASYGNDNATSLHLLAGRHTDALDITGRAAFTTTDGWRPHSQQERESIHAATRVMLDRKTDLTFQYFGSQPWYEVPGPLTKFAALHTPTAPQASILRDRPRRDTGYSHFNARATRRWADARFSLAAGITQTNDLFYQLQPNGISDTEATDAYLSIDGRMDWKPGNQHTTFRALLQSGWWDALRYRNQNGELGTLVGDHELRPLTLTAAIDHRLDLTETQHLDFGLSSLTARRDLNDHFVPIPGSVPLDIDFSGTKLAPRLAWSLDLTPQTVLSASWSHSYEPPTYNDLIYMTGPAATRVLRTTELAWQGADTFEVGLQGHHDRITWAGFLYYGLWQDEFLRLANPDGSSRGTVNADETIHAGLEASLEYDLYQRNGYEVTLGATYNYTDARFDGDPVYGDRRLGGVPPHMGSFSLCASTPGGWFLTPGCQWRGGDTYADHAHQLAYGGNCLWSLHFGLRHPDGWSVILGIDNLFDDQTIATTAGVLDRAPDPNRTAIFLPAAGRTVSLQFRLDW